MYFFILLHSANYMGKYVTCLLYLFINVSTSLFLYHDTQYCQSERLKVYVKKSCKYSQTCVSGHLLKATNLSYAAKQNVPKC